MGGAGNSRNVRWAVCACAGGRPDAKVVGGLEAEAEAEAAAAVCARARDAGDSRGWRWAACACACVVRATVCKGGLEVEAQLVSERGPHSSTSRRGNGRDSAREYDAERSSALRCNGESGA